MLNTKYSLHNFPQEFWEGKLLCLSFSPLEHRDPFHEDLPTRHGMSSKSGRISEESLGVFEEEGIEPHLYSIRLQEGTLWSLCWRGKILHAPDAQLDIPPPWALHSESWHGTKLTLHTLVHIQSSHKPVPLKPEPSGMMWLLLGIQSCTMRLKGRDRKCYILQYQNIT